MARKFCITEEQYNMAIREGVELKADVAAAGGDVKKAISNTKQEAIKNGVNMQDATISINASDTNESRSFVTKRQLEESRLKALKKNSRTYTVKDFKKRLNIK